MHPPKKNFVLAKLNQMDERVVYMPNKLFISFLCIYALFFPSLTFAGGIPHPDEIKNMVEHKKAEFEADAAAHPNKITSIANKCHIGKTGDNPFQDTVGFFATKEQTAGVIHHSKDAKEGIGNNGTPYPAELFYRTYKDPSHFNDKNEWFDDTKNPISTGSVSLGNNPGQVRCPGMDNSPLCKGSATFKHMLNVDKNNVSFQDQLNVGLYGASGIDSGKGLSYKPGESSPTPGSYSADYLRRGELLVYHPLAAPVNLMVWCIALEAQNALPSMVSHAVRLFTLLIMLEFIWMSVNFVLKFDSLNELIDALITKSHVWGISGSIILTGYYGFQENNWGYAIYSSFNKIGVEAVENIYLNYKDASNPDEITPSLSSLDTLSGNPGTSSANDILAGEALSPGSFFAMGVLMLTTIWEKVKFNIFLPITLLYLFLCLLITPVIIMMFSKMVADICLVVLEGYLGTGILLILVAFGATRFGQEFLQRVIVYFVLMGFKLIACYFLVAVGIRMMSYTVISLHFTTDLMQFITSLLSMLGITLLMGFLFHRLPSAAANFMQGAPMFSIGLLLGDTMENLSPVTKILGASKNSLAFAANKSGATKSFNNAKSKAKTKADHGLKSALKRMGFHNNASGYVDNKGNSIKNVSPNEDSKNKSAKEIVSEKGLGGSKNSKTGTAKADLKKSFKGVISKDVPNTRNSFLPNVVGPDDN